jgi:hypothetical protein
MASCSAAEFFLSYLGVSNGGLSPAVPDGVCCKTMKNHYVIFLQQYKVYHNDLAVTSSVYKNV